MRASEISRRLGIRVRAQREGQDLSQEQLAGRVGVTPQFVGDIERGLRGPTLETIAAIAEALDVTISDLLDGVDACGLVPDPLLLARQEHS